MGDFSISLCMIVRDEEALLRGALESVRGVVDELCIVDTGSSDRTVEIARECGARVECIRWPEDFAAARNVSLAMATGDWVLVLDADDRLLTTAQQPDPAALRSKLEGFAQANPTLGGQVLIVETHPDRSGEDVFDHAACLVTRFFPRSEAPHYVGRIHEQVHFASGEPRKAVIGVRYGHLGYKGDRIAERGKFARNRKLLEAALAESDEASRDPFLWWHLGRTLALEGDHEPALDAFGQALETVERTAPYLPSLIESTGYSLRSLGRSAEALALLENVESGYRDRADTVFLVALLAMDVGQLARAERGFERALSMAGQAPKDGGPFECSASTTSPAFNLGALHEVQGRPAEAEAYYRRVLGFDPEHAPAHAGLRRLAHSASIAGPCFG